MTAVILSDTASSSTSQVPALPAPQDKPEIRPVNVDDLAIKGFVSTPTKNTRIISAIGDVVLLVACPLLLSGLILTNPVLFCICLGGLFLLRLPLNYIDSKDFSDFLLHCIPFFPIFSALNQWGTTTYKPTESDRILWGRILGKIRIEEMKWNDPDDTNKLEEAEQHRTSSQFTQALEIYKKIAKRQTHNLDGLLGILICEADVCGSLLSKFEYLSQKTKDEQTTLIRLFFTHFDSGLTAVGGIISKINHDNHGLEVLKDNPSLRKDIPGRKPLAQYEETVKRESNRLHEYRKQCEAACEKNGLAHLLKGEDVLYSPLPQEPIGPRMLKAVRGFFQRASA